MVNYLTDSDYLTQIKSDLLDLITNNDANLRNRAELTGITEVESYLADRFNTKLVFLRYNDWDQNTSYQEGQRVVYEKKVYEALQASVGAQPDQSPNDWELVFERNELITTLLIDIVLYHLNARIAFDQTSTLRQDRYERAIEWLEKVAEGKLNPGLPYLDANEDGQADESFFRWQAKDKFRTKGLYF